MTLTGAPLVVILAVVAVGCFALVVAGWPRPSRRGAAMGVRAAQVLVLNVLVVALFGTLLNDQYLFYASWSDLLGARSTQVQEHHGGSQQDVAGATVAGPGLADIVEPVTLPALPDPGVRLQTYTVRDRASGSTGQVLVYLPVGYDPTSRRTYPVIEGLHGFPGHPRSFVNLNFLSAADQLTAQHRLAPSIFVMPMIDTPPSLDTECVDGPPGQPQTDTWLSTVVPDWVVRHFRAQTARTSWAAVGYSYGAWCAASLAMRHTDVFGGAIVLQGYFRPDFSTAYDPLTPESKAGYDLVHLARTAPPPTAMWVLTSHEDPLSYATTSQFLAAARKPLDVTAVVLAHGGHRTAVFTPYVPTALGWLGRTLPGFHA